MFRQLVRHLTNVGTAKLLSLSVFCLALSRVFLAMSNSGWDPNIDSCKTVLNETRVQLQFSDSRIRVLTKQLDMLTHSSLNAHHITKGCGLNVVMGYTDLKCEQDHFDNFMNSYKTVLRSASLKSQTLVLGPEYALASRQQFPEYLHGLGLRGTGIEIGVYEGEFAASFISRWQGQSYHGVDPHDVYENVLHSLPLKSEPRWHFHQKRDYQILDEFEDQSLDYVYIDSVHTYKWVSTTIEKWIKKIRPGGMISGHDFCCADHANYENEKKGASAYPLVAKHIKHIPSCGIYKCLNGYCDNKDKPRLGNLKIGFSGVVQAVLEAAERHERSVAFTLEGVNPGWGTGNPSWWFIV